MQESLFQCTHISFPLRPTIRRPSLARGEPFVSPRVCLKLAKNCALEGKDRKSQRLRAPKHREVPTPGRNGGAPFTILVSGCKLPRTPLTVGASCSQEQRELYHCGYLNKNISEKVHRALEIPTPGVGKQQDNKNSSILIDFMSWGQRAFIGATCSLSFFFFS